MKSIQNQHLFVYCRTEFIVGFFKFNSNVSDRNKLKEQKNQENLMQKEQSNLKTKTSETVNWFPVLYEKNEMSKINLLLWLSSPRSHAQRSEASEWWLDDLS